MALAHRQRLELAPKKIAAIKKAQEEVNRRALRDALEGDLSAFLRHAWRYIDPAPYITNWHIDAIAEHLQAVTRGTIKRLIVNIPPRCGKSTLLSVAWPAWTWAQRDVAPLSGPQVQFLFASYAHSLSMRDSLKTRRLIQSPFYQWLWGDRYNLTDDQHTKIRFENSEGGYRIATSVGGALTGEGGSAIVIDDAHNATEVESEAMRDSTLMWWDEAMSTRLSDPKSGAYVIIMQRLDTRDLTGHIIDKAKAGEWCHLMLPMRHDQDRHCRTVLGWQDPRKDEELLWPERFGEAEVSDLERRLGPYASSGQLQQSPTPRGGGIFKDRWWNLFELDDRGVPRIMPHFVVASLDPAYTKNDENDPSGFTVWGVFRDPVDGQNKITALQSWQKHLDMHGDTVERFRDEKDADYVRRAKHHWGLVEWVAYECRRLHVDRLLIESKASGITAAQEIRRLCQFEGDGWVKGVTLCDPKGQDKVARAYSVQHLFSEGLIHAPGKDTPNGYIFRAWADELVRQMSQFRPGAADDHLVDSACQALRWLRDMGLAIRREEAAVRDREAAARPINMQPLYPV